jgi:uncharacterized repeat protein (TIGR03803 family)
MWLMVAISSSAQTFTVIVNFNDDKGLPRFSGPLIQGIDGNFYDTTTYYNATGGTVFKVSRTGELTTLYKFCLLANCSDGQMPLSGLLLAANGIMYGTTAHGGANTCWPASTGTPGCGTIFQISPSGVLTTLYSFAGTDGAFPAGPLVQGTDGNLYGTTISGSTQNTGTVFMITPGGNLTTLYNFCNPSGCFGANPNALVQGADGNFYGTTSGGGNYGGGTVFRITPQGALTSYNLCTLTGCPGGGGPLAPLVQASSGNFYGTAPYGGNSGTTPVCIQGGAVEYGAVFEITPDGTFTSLYDFQNANDGAEPEGALIQASDGNLYGTTACGGSSSAGTIFSITPGGTFTPLYSFASPAGLSVGNQAGLLQGTDGNFYGTTPADGTDLNGTVFKFSMGLGPFVKTLPTSGGVGTVIQILGTGLTGATAVSFNGTAAVFTVVSDSDIQATVPTNATTGLVTVTTANGTLSSNQAFQVTTQAATPVFSPPAGIYPSAQNVTISDVTPKATIYYTTDGTTPTTSSTAYSTPITIMPEETIEAIAIASGYAPSAVTSAVYSIETPAPTFSPAPGMYASTQTVTISDAMSGATIYYTTDGSIPGKYSLAYSNPIAVSSPETIQAIAVAPGYSPSAVASALYIVGPPFTVQATTTWLEASPGGAAAYPLTVAPASGISTIPVAVSFSASGLPSGATATFSPNPVPTGAGSTTVTLTIQTSSSSARISSARMSWAVTLCVLIVPLAGTRRWRSRIWRSANGAGYLLWLLLLCTLSGALAGCGTLGAATGGAPSSHTYTVTITATGGGTSTTTTVLLKVRG